MAYTLQVENNATDLTTGKLYEVTVVFDGWFKADKLWAKEREILQALRDKVKEGNPGYDIDFRGTFTDETRLGLGDDHTGVYFRSIRIRFIPTGILVMVFVWALLAVLALVISGAVVYIIIKLAATVGGVIQGLGESVNAVSGSVGSAGEAISGAVGSAGETVKGMMPFLVGVAIIVLVYFYFKKH